MKSLPDQELFILSSNINRQNRYYIQLQGCQDLYKLLKKSPLVSFKVLFHYYRIFMFFQMCVEQRHTHIHTPFLGSIFIRLLTHTTREMRYRMVGG